MTDNQQGTGTNGGIAVPPMEDFNSTALQGSMQQILSENIGAEVVCEFLIGTSMIEYKAGILYSVGISFLVLYDDVNDIYIVCDIFAIKFVTFYMPGTRPNINPNPPMNRPVPLPSTNAAPAPTASVAPPSASVMQQAGVRNPSQSQAAFNYTMRKTKR